MSGGLVALVPVRSLSSGKTRLASVLSPDARESLMRHMVTGVIRAAFCSEAVTGVVVVSPDTDVLELASSMPRVTPIRQPADVPGLLPGLDLGRARAEAMRASGLLVLFGDLPLLDGSDIRHLVRRAMPVVIAPDRHGTGTNALLLRLSAVPTGERFVFQFGGGSYARHVAEAHRLGLDVATSISAGTSFDLDTPGDLDDLLADPRWMNSDAARELLAAESLPRAS
jgi:2-phospho-L-lactate/phosphoenolpyruvate guanylyltransferase